MRISRARNIDEGHILSIVELVSERLYDGNVIVKAYRQTSANSCNFTIRVKSSDGRGASRTYKGHRSVAANWHAYRDVLREFFRRYPDAHVLTTLARYERAEGFEREHPATFDRLNQLTGVRASGTTSQD